MSVIADILEAWSTVQERKGKKKEDIANLLDKAAEEATYLANTASKNAGCDFIDPEVDILLKGHCAALNMLYRESSSVIDIPETLETFVFRIAGIETVPMLVLAIRKGEETELLASGNELEKLSEQAGELRAFAAIYRASN